MTPRARRFVEQAGDYRMMKGYLDTPGGSTTYVSVSDLPTSIVNADSMSML